MSFSGRVLWRTDSSREGCRVKHAAMLSTRGQTATLNCWVCIVTCCKRKLNNSLYEDWHGAAFSGPYKMLQTLDEFFHWLYYRFCIGMPKNRYAFYILRLFYVNTLPTKLWLWQVSIFLRTLLTLVVRKPFSKCEIKADWGDAATTVVGVHCGHTLV